MNRVPLHSESALILAMPGTGVRTLFSKETASFHLDLISYRRRSMNYFSDWLCSVPLLRWKLYSDKSFDSPVIYYGWAVNWKDLIRIFGSARTYLYVISEHKYNGICYDYRQTPEYEKIEKRIFAYEGLKERPIRWYVQNYLRFVEEATIYLEARMKHENVQGDHILIG